MIKDKDNFNKIFGDNKKESLQTELDFILDMKATMATKEGKNVILQILKMTDILSLKTFTGNSYTYYALGMNFVGKQILETLTKANIKVDTIDLSKHLERNLDRIEQIRNEINKLTEEEKKDGRRYN